MRGTATKAIIKATPTRNWVMLEAKKALDVYRKDANSGWTACLSTKINETTRKIPRAAMEYGTMDSPEKMLLWDSAMVRTVRDPPSNSAPK